MTIDQSPIAVTLRAADVAAAARSRHALTFKGFGVLSGNSTSALLLDYKAGHPDRYRELIDTLFGGNHPLMTCVKIEMGNDRNTSTGPNAATMRERDAYPNVLREPGFHLAADARHVQPGLHVSILRWCAPTWVRGNDDVYRWYKNTTLACYREYGFMVNTVNPDINEHKPDLAWVAEFARRVRTDADGFLGNGPDDPNAGWRSETERDLFHAIRVITSDEESTGTFGPALLADAELRDAIDIAAYHYSSEDDESGSFTRLADDYDKEIWNSEAQAVFSNSADRPNNTNDRALGDGSRGTGIGGPGGPLEMANTIIKGFVTSRRTCVIYQPAIGACYGHLQYAAKELVSMRAPWSGWIYYDAGCAVLAHFAAFARLGWEPQSGDRDAARIRLVGEPRGCDRNVAPMVWRAIPQASGCTVAGRNPVNGARHGEPSYLTFTAPDGGDFSTVIVNDSALSRTYRIAVDPALAAAGRPLAVWRTAAAKPGERYDAGWLRRDDDIVPDLVPASGPDVDSCAISPVGADSADALSSGYTRWATATVNVAPWSMVTITTLRDVTPSPLPASGEDDRPVLDMDPARGVLYADDFRYADAPDMEVSRADGASSMPYLDARGGDDGAVPRYTNDLNGAFEIVLDVERGHALRQQIDRAHVGAAWNDGDPRTAIGDMRWTNYRASVDVRFETGATVAHGALRHDDVVGGGIGTGGIGVAGTAAVDASPAYAMLGVREMGGAARPDDTCAYDLRLQPDGMWTLRRYGTVIVEGVVPANGRSSGDRTASVLASASLDMSDDSLAAPAAPAESDDIPPASADDWHRLELQAADAEITAWIDGERVARWTDPAPQTAGRVNLGSSFDYVRFSNLRVERVPGYAPTYTALIDDMHMVSWADSRTPVLEYAGEWTHENGQDMFTYMRTVSRTAQPRATLTHTFEGTGIDLFGRSDGGALLDVIVDGATIATAQPTVPTDGSLRAMFRVGGLPRDRHTVAIRLANAHELALDAVGVLA